jgi:DNA-binding transcriptional MerR regulator
VNKLKNISEVSQILNLVDPKTNKPKNYILRYWEKEFKIVKPKKINKRRYYTSEQLEIMKTIKFLLKNKGMTVAGVKNLLKTKINKLDVGNDDGLKANNLKIILQIKSKKLLEKINKIKIYGKKNTS